METQPFAKSIIKGKKNSLLKFSHWLREKLPEAHNPISLIINTEEKQRKK